MDSYGACIRGPLIQSLDTTTTCMYYVLAPKLTLDSGYEAYAKQKQLSQLITCQRVSKSQAVKDGSKKKPGNPPFLGFSKDLYSKSVVVPSSSSGSSGIHLCVLQVLFAVLGFLAVLFFAP